MKLGSVRILILKLVVWKRST